MLSIIGWAVIALAGLLTLLCGLISLHALKKFDRVHASDRNFSFILIIAGLAILYGAWLMAPFEFAMKGGAG